MEPRTSIRQEEKVAALREAFAPLVGSKIVRYETADLLLEAGTWSSWADLPIRIFSGAGVMTAVSWSKLDDLWLATDESLPFDIGDSTIRWVVNTPAGIAGCLNQTLHGVMLGRGQWSDEDLACGLWTALVLQLDDCWLEIFNALDENGYELHRALPAGEFIQVV